MGAEAEFRDAQMRIARLDESGAPGPWVPVRHVEFRVVPPDDDEWVTVRADDLVGMRLSSTEVPGLTAVARREGGFVVIQYEDGPSYHRTLIRADAWVRVKRHV